MEKKCALLACVWYDQILAVNFYFELGWGTPLRESVEGENNSR